jgi:ferredoxin-thioredoxin reductase catalytic subunit
MEVTPSKRKFTFNPDLSDDERVTFIAKIRKNDGYCPCSIEKNLDTKCRCKEFREQDEPGPCHCGLYVKL